MIVTFLSPTQPHPVGGVGVIFEFANALAARGHTVQILHHGIFGKAVDGLDEIDWFTFHPAVVHQFTGIVDPEPDEIPSADIFFGFAPSDRFDERYGLPVVLIQGYGMFPPGVEDHAFKTPCPKVCVARWLVELGIEKFKMPAHQFVHVPPGLHHENFAIRIPIEKRPPRITFLHNTHRKKGADVAIAALELVRAQVPDVDVQAFGTFDLGPNFPDWIHHHRSPGHAELVDSIYNTTSIFLSPSRLEGFGLPAVEAMACGAALVATASGGTADYALHDETALVCESEDHEGLAAHMLRLLADDSERIRLARAGHAYVQRYDWANAGAELEGFLERYLADPSQFGLGVSGDGFSEGERSNYS